MRWFGMEPSDPLQDVTEAQAIRQFLARISSEQSPPNYSPGMSTPLPDYAERLARSTGTYERRVEALTD